LPVSRSTAPFDSVITQRNADVGSLVQGDVTGGAFMFEIQQKDVIRIWVYVPQDARIDREIRNLCPSCGAEGATP
jgi:hypothetical protein